jgi:hypothetical protein
MAERSEDPILADLKRRLAEAVAAEDFEAAADLRDAIEVRGAGGSKLRPQIPGKMGLGTSDPAHVPPKGWVRPKKPAPMVGDHRPRGGRKD